MDYLKVGVGTIVGLVVGATLSGVVAQQQQNDRPEVVMRQGLAPTRAAPNGTSQITPFAEGEHGFMGVLRVEPGAEIPEHEEASEEYLYVLEGEGELVIDGTSYEVRPNSGIFLPAEATVRYKNGSRVMKAVQFFAPPESANKYSDWETGQTKMQNDRRGSKRKSNRGGEGEPEPSGESSE